MGWEDGGREWVELECRMSVKGEWEMQFGGQVQGRVVEGLESNHKILYSSSKDRCVDFVDIWKCVFGEKIECKIVCTNRQLYKHIMVC